MTPLFDRVVRQAEAWLQGIDEERDRAAGFISRYGGSAELDGWLDALERERAKHVEMMAGLGRLIAQQHPALLRDVRPVRMVKATIRRSVGRRTGTDR
jgi:hypothetical protein